MNRTALCLRMLQILNARGFVMRKDLARMLETNTRNIPEFKKELELAGYTIEVSRGRYGGYRLRQPLAISSLPLEQAEMKAVDEAVAYLESRSDYLYFKDFERAYEKIKVQDSSSKKEGGIVFQNQYGVLSTQLIEWIQVAKECRQKNIVVEIEYKSLNKNTYEKRLIHPYEIINVKQAYYLIAYQLSSKDYRCFKFSDVRMKSLRPTSSFFNRDRFFNLKEHIGKTGVMKSEILEVECLIHGQQATLVYEKEIGIYAHKEWLDGHCLHLKTAMESEVEAIEFLLSLGSDHELIAPLYLKEKIYSIIQQMQLLYQPK